MTNSAHSQPATQALRSSLVQLGLTESEVDIFLAKLRKELIANSLTDDNAKRAFCESFAKDLLERAPHHARQRETVPGLSGKLVKFLVPGLFIGVSGNLLTDFLKEMIAGGSVVPNATAGQPSALSSPDTGRPLHGESSGFVWPCSGSLTRFINDSSVYTGMDRDLSYTLAMITVFDNTEICATSDGIVDKVILNFPTSSPSFPLRGSAFENFRALQSTVIPKSEKGSSDHSRQHVSFDDAIIRYSIGTSYIKILHGSDICSEYWLVSHVSATTNSPVTKGGTIGNLSVKIIGHSNAACLLFSVSKQGRRLDISRLLPEWSGSLPMFI